MFWWRKPWQRHSGAQENNNPPQGRLIEAFQAKNFRAVQELLNCLILSECIYKLHDVGPQKAVEAINEIQNKFPPGLLNIQSIQCSLPHAHHRYLVASSPDTIYVSFIGTKLARDVLADANFFHRPLWKAEKLEQNLPAVHRGFLDRARKVPVEKLLAIAETQKKKLLLCGHSLGGAIASLSTLKLLQQAANSQHAPPSVSCVTFGTPAIGNAALSSKVQEQGWTDCFRHVILPEDLIPRLLSMWATDSPPQASSLETSDQGAKPRWSFGVVDGWKQAIFNSSTPAATPNDGPQESDCPAASQLADQDGKPAGVKSRLQNASRWRNFVRETPHRLWHKHQLDQDGMQESQAIGDLKEEEDGAVDMLMQAGADGVQADGTQADGSKQSWVQHLWKLQGAAVSAASVVGNMGQMLPNRIHFGNSSSWAKADESEGLGVRRMEDARSWILAHHRMPAYRARALAMCRGLVEPVATADPQWMAAPGIQLSDSLLPHPICSSAVAYTKPHLPLDSAESSSARWTWLPNLRRWKGSQQQQGLDIQVQGSHLHWLNKGRLHIFHTHTFPARLQPVAGGGGDRVGRLQLETASWFPEWLRAKLTVPASDQTLHASIQIPQPIALQVANLDRRSVSRELELHLRSDFNTLVLPVQLKLPTVYLLGSSISAVHNLAAALSLHEKSHGHSHQTLHSQPPEFLLDGTRWCNLLAAETATPKLAASILASALASRADSNQSWLAGANHLVEGFRAWMLGPNPSSIERVDKGSTVLIALDGKSGLPRRLVSRLVSEAKASGTPVIVAHLGAEQSEEDAGLADFLHQQRSVRNISLSSTAIADREFLQLRRSVYESLMQNHYASPISRL